MTFFLKFVKVIAKYGKKAVQWAWKNKWKILEWGYYAYEVISNLFG